MTNRLARWVAGISMLLAVIGLGTQFAASLKLTGSAPTALWAMLRYFTVTTNLCVALIMGAIACGMLSLRSSMLIGGMTLSIMLVGIIYFALLRGLLELSGGALLADTLLHMVVPAATLLFWLLLVPKPGLRWRDPLLWMLYPAVYLAYALARGGADGKYPYPFIDIGRIGWDAALVNCGLIAFGFVSGGLLLVAADHLLGRGHPNQLPGIG